MRLGILGGTFDPIHVGHLIIAEEARVRLSLEEVVFIPTGQPWLKAVQPVSPGELRLQMVRLAVAENPFFRASALELERPGPTYTVDTLAAVHKEWGPGVEVYFIMGTDTLVDLPRWKEPRRFLELCVPVVYARPNHSREAWEELERQLPGLGERVRRIETPLIGVNGTEIRRRVACGISIRYLVPARVERFIAEHGLYRAAGAE
ncbi:MAG: nicotinate-nucleotide adenylyltransferase [Chloroflexi bacterium]|nr:nicotinate-nucleotide adenylyltransferase [Chloroflexota bacterium]